MDDNFDIIVIGAGPAGIMAAGRAAEVGKSVLLLEKNRILGAKLLLSGNGRCNLTNDTELGKFMDYYVDSKEFLYNILHSFSNHALLEFFHKRGLATKVEDEGRVFPVSDKAKDVVRVLQSYLDKANLKIEFSKCVSDVLVSEKKVQGVKTKNGEIFPAERVIVATGGMSYPQTGSSGDGYPWAEKAGHTIIDIRPGLVGLEVEEKWVKQLQGLSLRDVQGSLFKKGVKIKEGTGEMVFSHFGLSGPLIFSLSMYAVDTLRQGQVLLKIDLSPALTIEQLKDWLDKEIQSAPLQYCKNFLSLFLPPKLIPVLISLSGINPEKRVNQLTRLERTALINKIKALNLTIKSARPIQEAIVTRGGVCTKEVNPKTMESKLIQGLYFCGEILDIAGLSGGFNLQAAFSTGFVAGQSSAQSG